MVLAMLDLVIPSRKGDAFLVTARRPKK